LGDYVDEDSNGKNPKIWIVMSKSGWCCFKKAEDYYQNDYPDEEDSEDYEDRKYFFFWEYVRDS
jgi:hypothetical protein